MIPMGTFNAERLAPMDILIMQGHVIFATLP